MAKGRGVVRCGQQVAAFLAVMVLTWAMVGCAKPTEPTVLLSEPTEAPHLLAGPIAEVSPPETLDTLKQIIDAYTPQVRILSPRPGEVVESATVSVRFQVRGLPLFKDETWQLGPHLHVFLDDQPYQAVYDASEPLVLEDLAPGTHTLRVFASRPWHESFKNEGAFDQRTFHIFAPTPQNEVNASAPLLTYSRPQGTYGAEPIMLDFYLTNAPLHLSAQEDPKDDLHDWRIRCTVNGQSFVFDQWQPIYLKGFQPGKNWVQLELIDETGRPIDNRFNNTVRVVDYQPGGTDTLSRLVRGELDLNAVASIIDPTYTPPLPPEPADAPKATTESDGSQDVVDPALPEPLAEQAEEATPKADILENPELENPELENPELESLDLPPQDVPEEAPSLVPVPVHQTLSAPSTQEEEARADRDPVSAEDAPIVEDEVGDGREDAASDAAINMDAAPVLAPLTSGEFPLQTQTQTRAQTQTQTPPDSPADRAKGMMKRWKRWADQQTLPGFGATQPDPELAPPVPVYEVPAANSPALDTPETGSTDEANDLPMVMPELIEPYLTQPYMTEPRLELQPFDPEEGAMGEEIQQPREPSLGPTEADQDTSTERENSPADEDSTSPNPVQPGQLQRSYI